MQYYNLTRKTEISADVQKLSSFWEKVLGLLSNKHSRSLAFETRFGVHTFGLKVPVDVIVLDSQLKVVKAATVSPNRFLFWSIRYSKVVELPEGTIFRSKTACGDMVKILGV